MYINKSDACFSLAINGYVAETLPGLIVAQHQPVRWHLLNVGGDKEYHAVHFHGLPFTVHAKQEHRMGVFNLFPGKNTQRYSLSHFTKGHTFLLRDSFVTLRSIVIYLPEVVLKCLILDFGCYFIHVQLST